MRVWKGRSPKPADGLPSPLYLLGGAVAQRPAYLPASRRGQHHGIVLFGVMVAGEMDDAERGVGHVRVKQNPAVGGTPGLGAEADPVATGWQQAERQAAGAQGDVEGGLLADEKDGTAQRFGERLRPGPPVRGLAAGGEDTAVEQGIDVETAGRRFVEAGLVPLEQVIDVGRVAVDRGVGTVGLGHDGKTGLGRALEQHLDRAPVLNPGVGVEPEDDLPLFSGHVLGQMGPRL